MLSIVVIAGIADGLPDDGVVFLFNKTAIILAIGTAARKGDLLFGTVSQEFSVNELTAVIRVNTFDLKGNFPGNISERFKDPPLSLGLESTSFRPARGDVGEIKRMDHLRARNTAIMSHEIDFDKAWRSLVPLREGSDRDLMLEQSTGLGGGASF